LLVVYCVAGEGARLFGGWCGVGVLWPAALGQVGGGVLWPAALGQVGGGVLWPAALASSSSSSSSSLIFFTGFLPFFIQVYSL